MTLFDVHAHAFSVHNQQPAQTLDVGTLYLGTVHATRRREVTALCLEYPELENWIGRGPFVWTGGSVGPRDDTDERFDVTVGTEAAELMLWFGTSLTFSDFHPRLDSVARVNITLTSPVSFARANEIEWHFRGLLSLFVGQGCHPSRVSLITPKGSYEVMPREWVRRVTRVAYEHEMPLPLSVVRGNLAETVSKWFQNERRLRSIVQLWYSVYYGANVHVETDFIALCRAIEGYASLYQDTSYMDQRDYERDVRAPIAAAIPGEIPAGLRERLKKQLEFGNERSLRSKLRELFRGKKAMLELIDGARDKAYVDGLVDLRNTLTHVRARPARRPARVQEFLTHLRQLIPMLLLHEAGVLPDSYAGRIKRAWWPKFAGG